MTTPLLFQAWDPQTKSMSPPISLHDIFLSECGRKDLYSRAFGAQLIWRQYTGKDDMNGKPIFNYDILTGGLHVVWLQQACSYALVNKGWGHHFVFGLSRIPSKLTIIGNSLENPELLIQEKGCDHG